MNRVRGCMIFGAVVGLLLSGSALAGPKEREQRHRDARDKIRTLRLMKLVEALDLDDKTGMRVARVLKQADEEAVDEQIEAEEEEAPPVLPDPEE